jgi:hypothetical protein
MSTTESAWWLAAVFCVGVHPCRDHPGFRRLAGRPWYVPADIGGGGTGLGLLIVVALRSGT